jgi:uncharacterized protein (TIGR02996 family)
MVMTGQDVTINNLLKQIITTPEDDTVRLAYADALEERGAGDDALWAANVRYMVTWLREGYYGQLTTPDRRLELSVNQVIRELKQKPLFTTNTPGHWGDGGYRPFHHLWDHWDRGFIDEATADDFAEWVRVAEFLYWHPGRACRCAGTGRDAVWEDRCGTCDGTGTLPCPPTAHPIRKVFLRSGEPDVPLGYFYSHLYPGIRFEGLR